MKKNLNLLHCTRLGVLLAATVALPYLASAQVRTNWVAYNDFSAGPGTAPGVSGYDMGFGPGGPLTNYPAGQFPAAELPSGLSLVGRAELVVTPVNANGVFGLPAAAGYPFPDTPAYALFTGICDMGNLGSAFGVGGGQAVNLTFKGLNPAMRYKFRGSVVRNGTAVGTHDVRWTLNSITGAASFVNAHSSGTGLITAASPIAGLTLTNGQAAFQSGINTNGMVVGWDEIVPGADGSFTVVNQSYNGPTDVNSASANIGYVLTAIMVTEYGPLTGLTVTTQPQSIATTQLVTFALTVKASGSAPYYQWYKEGLGAIPGANGQTYRVDAPAVGDAGVYYAIITNSLGSVTSQTATVTVALDTVAPSIARVIGNATFDGFTVEFTEPVRITEAEDPLNYTLTGPGGPVGVSSATGVVASGRQFDGVQYVSSVVLTCGALSENTQYSVAVSQVQDGVGNVTTGGPLSFRTWLTTPASGLLFEVFAGIGGNAISDLTGHPSFPNNPSTNGIIGVLDSRAFYADDSHEGYGSRTRGVFIPPYSGNWRLFLRSDDAGRVFLNPHGPDPAGKVQILDEPSCCGEFSKIRSDVFPLVGGQAYYVEALHKEGTGGDYVKVAARLDGTGAPPSSPAAAVDPAAIAGSAVGYPAAPAGVAGAITITQQPTNVTTLEGQLVTFSVGANNTYGLPMSYQWRRDGAVIPGANAASYSLVPALADGGAQFSVDISIIGAAVQSASASLTVQHDMTPPTVVSAQVGARGDVILVTFSELLDMVNGTATDPLNYQLFQGAMQLQLISASLRPDGRTVVLTLDPGSLIQPDTQYRLVVNNVQDLAGNPVAADTMQNFQSFPLSRGFLQFDYFSGITGNAVSALVDDPRFAADTPTASYILTAFDTRVVFPDNSHETYGGRISGVFIPPASGNWIFYLSSDDSSQLFFNANGSGANGAVMLVEETACCNGFASHPTAPQALTAGSAYYIEARYKEGTGGDYCQVAAKLESDPTAPNALSPISGSYLGFFVDPSGSSVTITRQPADQSAASPVIQAFTSQNFAMGSGGFTVVNTGPVGGPWVYNAASGSWTANGTDPCGTPSSSALISREYVVQTAGPLTLRLNHRYSFEYDGTRWDGGQVRVSVNGGPYTTVSDFAQNGYNGVVTGNNALNGQDSFTSASPDYGTGATIDSDANLGMLAAGDRVRFQFLGAWDECSRGPLPNWEIKSVAFIAGSVKEITPSPATFTVAASGVYKGNNNPPFSYLWQKDTGSGFVDIPNSNASTVTLFPDQSDNGARIRCIVYVPGASVISAAALLTVGPDLDIVQTGPDTVVLSWPESSSGFSVEQTSALLTPATTVWGPAPGTPAVVNGRYTLTLTGAGVGNKFYRLNHP